VTRATLRSAPQTAPGRAGVAVSGVLPYTDGSRTVGEWEAGWRVSFRARVSLPGRYERMPDRDPPLAAETGRAPKAGAVTRLSYRPLFELIRSACLRAVAAFQVLPPQSPADKTPEASVPLRPDACIDQSGSVAVSSAPRRFFDARSPHNTTEEPNGPYEDPERQHRGSG
jgi:hypothetical protein